MCLNATLLSLGGPKAKAAQWWGNQGCVSGKQGLQFAWCGPGADCNYGLHAQRGVCRPSFLLLKKSDISTLLPRSLLSPLLPKVTLSLIHSCIQLVLFECHIQDAVLDPGDIEEQETPIGARYTGC